MPTPNLSHLDPLDQICIQLEHARAHLQYFFDGLLIRPEPDGVLINPLAAVMDRFDEVQQTAIKFAFGGDDE